MTSQNQIALLLDIQKKNLLTTLIQQTNKDVAMVGIKFHISESSNPQNMVLSIQKLVTNLLHTNFLDYVNLLYRVDIPEEQIKALQNLETSVLTEKVTILIVQREWKKVLFKSKNQ